MSKIRFNYSGCRGIWDWPSHNWNTSCGQTNQYFKDEMDVVCSESRKYQSFISNKSKHQVLSCVNAHGKGNLHFCDDNINAEKYIEILEQHTLSSSWHLFQGQPCIFQQDNDKPFSAGITKAWLWKKRVLVMDWPTSKCLESTFCYTLDRVAPPKRKIIWNNSLAPWHNINTCTLKWTTGNLDCKWSQIE